MRLVADQPHLCLAVISRTDGARTIFRRLQLRNRRAPWKLGDDAYLVLRARIVAELDVAIDQSEDRMVSSQANVIARLDLRAALAHNNAASSYQFPIIMLHAEHLRIAIAPVA